MRRNPNESRPKSIPRPLRAWIGELIRTQEIPPGLLAPLAKALGYTPRSLRNWARPGQEESAPPGRPPTSEEELEAARNLVHEQLELQGWDAGEEPIWRGLGEVIPLARSRRVLAELKAARRKRIRQAAEERRVSVKVMARDAIWSMDATHLGRLSVGAAVQAEVIRELASTRTIGLSVGLPATGEDVVMLLEQTRRERGAAPLVLQTDNGGAYVSAEVEAWCEQHGVLHLYSLPRTPQHNGSVEHGMCPLKSNAGLGKGTRLESVDEARAKLVGSRDRLDAHRLRRTRNWMTPLESDQANPHWSTLVSREEVLQKAACALEQGLVNCTGKRAERRAAREAILGTLQHFNLIQRTRGGLPWTAQSAERFL